MKKLFAITIGFVFILTSCSSNEPNEFIDTQYLNSITRGEVTTIYKLKEEKLYKKSSSDNEFKRAEDICGVDLPGAMIITFHEGNVCVPLVLFYEAVGPHPLSIPLSAYRKKTGFTGDFFVTSRMEYDENTNKMVIGKYTYTVQSATKNELILNHYSQYIESHTGNKGTYKSVLRYEVQQVNVSQLADSYFYDTDYDAYMGLLNLIREELGSVINVNEYLAPAFEYDDPIYDLDEIEAKLKEDLDYWLKWENRIPQS